jgi:hypothetical protein
MKIWCAPNEIYDFPLKYIEQTVWTFYARYKEHIQAVKNNNDDKRYSDHILNTGHSCGNITDTMIGVKSKNKENI